MKMNIPHRSHAAGCIFRLLGCKAVRAGKLQSCCSRCVPASQLFSSVCSIIFKLLLFPAVHGALNATTDHTAIFERVVLKEFSDAEWRESFWDVPQVFKKKKKMCETERTLCPQDETVRAGDDGGNSSACCKTAVVS